MAAVSVEKVEGAIAVVSLHNAPVNIMDRNFWQQLHDTFDSLEKDDSVRGVVFQSGLKRNVFAAGLDIEELYVPKTSEEKVFSFWTLLTKTLNRIYRTPMMTAAAIKGACPAGGCCLSMCCDHRVITADGSMGLNEVALGMGGVPFFWAELMAMTCGHRATEHLVMSGDMAKAEECLRIQLVDAIVPAAADVLPAALAEVRRWLKNPDLGRLTCKGIMREAFAEKWLKGTNDEAAFIWGSISQPPIVKNIGRIKEMLAKADKKEKAKL